MEQLLRIGSHKKPKHGDRFCDAEMFQAGEEPRKMYIIGPNRKPAISARSAVSHSYARGCGMVLLALDVHYASA